MRSTLAIDDCITEYLAERSAQRHEEAPHPVDEDVEHAGRGDAGAATRADIATVMPPASSTVENSAES